MVWRQAGKMDTAQIQFSCPLDCLAGVGEVFGGQYHLPTGSTINGIPTVLDIGANCGAFTIWARMIWPGCRVIAYEPQPDIFSCLQANLRHIPNTAAHNAAVGDPGCGLLFRGLDSRLCASQYQIGEQSAASFNVPVEAPEKLSPADIVKIDAEGAEAFIVEHLSFIPAALIMEWHGAENRRRVELALEGKMKLASARIVSLDRGIYCYLKP